MTNTDPTEYVLASTAFRGRRLDDVLTAAAGSGFSAVGLSIAQCVTSLERGTSLSALREKVQAAGLEVASLELYRLGAEGPERHLNSLVDECVSALQPTRIVAAGFSGDLADYAAETAKLCSAYPEIDIAVEFIPYSNIPDLDAAVKIIESAGQSNAKLVIDAVHFFRSNADWNELTPAVLDGVADVQLSDLVARPGITTKAESRHLRTFPGDGQLPLVPFLRALAGKQGKLRHVTVEIMSDAIERLPTPWAVERSMQTTANAVHAALNGDRYNHY